MSDLRIGFVIPAAGLSRRHPPNKLLLNVNGRPAIQKTVLTVLALPYPLCVVVGHEAKKMMTTLAALDHSRFLIVENPDYKTGMAGSIITGISALPDDLDYFGFLPGDKPFVRPQTITAMIMELDTDRPEMLIPTYQGQIGHPTFFSTALRDEFMHLTGDTGGREIIERYPQRVHYLPMNAPEIIRDMDRWLEEDKHDE
ncbi:MAG: nucleotidyltransferase family protein [Candidatus Marinimicrobia bacterium]|nr:nucleotidyltransferase family protein [Candidatus Neomarinimicrobiota bacterium]MCF7839628.1 nucleotidyltransferase family protein [Candidatus Neomarinimicrobiota bacterium]MCF7902507.1 nucleotidyltransferase family protein [Candidatus Neomarinimicrobiota bacterium]